MKISVSRADVWAATIEDRPGGLAEKLEALAAAGANLEFVVSRRMPDKPGKGVVFITPLKGAKQLKAGQAAGFQTSKGLHSVRVEGTDQPGSGAKMIRARADAGINLKGVSGAALGRKFVGHLALDTPEDATKALAVLRKLS